MPATRHLIIAIDGPSGAGKGTVARTIARRLGYRHIDTGAMYRAVAWKALRERVDLADAAAVAQLARHAAFELEGRIAIDDADVTDLIRTPEIDEAAAIVARHPPVREVLVALDRRIARPDDAAESAITRTAASLRVRAVTRLAEISRQIGWTSHKGPDRVDIPGTQTMNLTPFPATPTDVAVLTVQEFTFDLDEFNGQGIPSMERICRTFMDDANRALVWWIRFAALKAWRTSPDVIARSMSVASTSISTNSI